MERSPLLNHPTIEGSGVFGISGEASRPHENRVQTGHRPVHGRNATVNRSLTATATIVSCASLLPRRGAAPGFRVCRRWTASTFRGLGTRENRALSRTWSSVLLNNHPPGFRLNVLQLQEAFVRGDEGGWDVVSSKIMHPR